MNEQQSSRIHRVGRRAAALALSVTLALTVGPGVAPANLARSFLRVRPARVEVPLDLADRSLEIPRTSPESEQDEEQDPPERRVEDRERSLRHHFISLDGNHWYNIIYTNTPVSDT